MHLPVKSCGKSVDERAINVPALLLKQSFIGPCSVLRSKRINCIYIELYYLPNDFAGKGVLDVLGGVPAK